MVFPDSGFHVKSWVVSFVFTFYTVSIPHLNSCTHTENVLPVVAGNDSFQTGIRARLQSHGRRCKRFPRYDSSQLAELCGLEDQDGRPSHRERPV